MMAQVGRYRVGLLIAIVALATAGWAGGCFGGSDDTTTAETPPAVGTVILLRGGQQAERGLEVLLLRHGPKAYLGPGDWGFPGGAARSDADVDQSARAAAVKALADQASIEVDPAELVPYADWIAPIADTHYYLAIAPADSTPRPDGTLTVDGDWFEPRRALAMHRAGKLPMGYSTIKQIESLVGFANADDAVETARQQGVQPVRLRIVGEGDNRRAVLPGEAPQG
jgi:ADP-ribose pyrophosphatase YjhB (NUDIX family)